MVNVDLVNNQNLANTNPNKFKQVSEQYVATSETDLSGIQFQGLAKGPESVENGRYANMLFAIDNNGRLYAFDEQGVLQPVFNNGATSVDTGLTDARGLAFSALDDNLFHATPNVPTTAPNFPLEPGTPATSERQADVGHGITDVFDSSRVAVGGKSSIHFGLGTNGRLDGETGNLNFPGGASGTVVSNEFDLSGYSSSDQPVMYFNYFATTEGKNSLLGAANPMTDSFRVFVGGDDGNWQLVATNNSARGGMPFDDEFDYGTTFGAPQVQELYDNSQWRQVRVDLGAFAGQSNLRVRFDYSAAGRMNLGDINTTGEELRAVSAAKLKDGDTFVIDPSLAVDPTNPFGPGIYNGGTVFEFDSGLSLVFNSGNSYTNGETFTVTPAVGPAVTFGFNAPGVPGVVNVPINNSGPNIFTPQQVLQAVSNALLGAFGVGFRRVTLAALGDNVLNIPDALAATENLAVANFITGNVGVTAGRVRVPFQRDWDRVQVADSMNAA